MKARFPTLYARVTVGPRVHRIFSGIGFVLAVLLFVALIAVGDGDMSQRFSTAFGKGIILIVFAGGYFGYALSMRATKDPAWSALVEGRISRVSPWTYVSGAISEPQVKLELKDGATTSVSCQTLEQQQSILEEFRSAGIEVGADS